MDEYVIVPTELDDSLKDVIINDPLLSSMSPIKQEVFWCSTKRHFHKVVAYFQANPVISDDAMGTWSKTAEKRAAMAAKVPVLSKELPDTLGFWWHRPDDLSQPPEVRCIYFSLTDQCFKCSSELGLKEMGGWWAKCVPPELPKEEVE